MVVFLCFCGGVLVVFLWWCFSGAVLVVVFLLWCFCGCVFVVVFLWWCFCVGVMVFLCWCVGACYGAYSKIKKKLEGGWGGGRSASPPMHSLQEMHCRC